MNVLYRLLILSFICSTNGLAQEPKSYYDRAEGLRGFELKTALKEIIDDVDDGYGLPYHIDQGYASLFEAFASERSGDTDIYYENDGTVLDMYSEVPDDNETYTYSHYINQCGNYSQEGDCYNREHLVPQSTFHRASPMRNDYFHIIPTDGYVNGIRSNFPFGEVEQPNYISSNSSKRGLNTFPGYYGTVFEPIDEFKGDIARAVLYFAIRYEDEFNSSWNKNEVLTDNPQEFYKDWYLKLLLKWHLKDPVSQKEIDRNTNGFNYQGNRNPLVDHPEYVVEIWGNVDNQAPTPPNNLKANLITSNSFELSWQPATDLIGIKEYIIEQDHVEIAQVSSKHLNYTIMDLTPETLYNIRVFAVDASGNVSEPSENLEVLTHIKPDTILNEDFEDCTQVDQNFVTVMEQNSFDWECRSSFGVDDSQAYVINSYQNGETQESKTWLITSRQIDFEKYEAQKMSFWVSARYGNTELELLYSSTYDGLGNPSNFEWIDVPNISIPLHPESNSSLFSFNANAIDISDISGKVYFAFRYDTTSGKAATQWTIDDILITGEQLLSSQRITNAGFKLYPNPLKNSKLHMDFNNNQHKRIELFDMTGKKVWFKNTYLRKCEENLDQLEKGVYFVKVSQGNTSSTKRLILK